MQIHTRRFGSPGRELVGILQTPTPGAPGRVAFLMGRPFGQEAIRTAPIYRAMSDRLSREGCTVLTFDHHGCGDSPGDLDDQSLDAWTSDTLAADAQLRSDAPGVPVHWFGMGLGANIASLAAQRCEPAPNCLVLREPVLNGRAYLQRLMTVHREEMAREMGRNWTDLVRYGGEAEPELPGSVLGFVVGRRLHEQVAQIAEVQLAKVTSRVSNTVLVVPAAELARFKETNNVGLKIHAVETPTNWMSTEAFGTAIVPQEVPRTLLATL